MPFIRHLSATTQNEACPFQEQSSITGLPQSEQRAELSLETQEVSMLITRCYLATSAPRHREVFFHCQHHLSGPLALSFALPLYPHRWLPLSSCQLLPGLTTNEESLWQHVWDSEMTPLSLPLSHCYWDGREDQHL